MAVMLGMLGVFFLGIIIVLYVTLKKSSSFDDYAVGGRSFGPWLVAMSYVNSWWPGTVFISFAGLSVASGMFGFYGLAYSTLGLAAMYFIATRAWRWGKHYNLVTQPDLLRLRYGSKAVGVVRPSSAWWPSCRGSSWACRRLRPCSPSHRAARGRCRYVC